MELDLTRLDRPFAEDLDRLRAVLDAIYEGLQIISDDWRYLYLNPAAARHGRRTRDELIGRTMMECYPGIETTEVFGKLQRCMRARTRDHFENQFVYVTGETAWFDLWIEPCPEGIVIVSLDVTARKQLEGALVRTEKLSALGRMAAGVAHNLGNILNPLALQLELLGRRMREHPNVVEIVGRMKLVIDHGKQTIDLLKGFGRAPTSDAVVDLDEIAEEVVGLCTTRAAGSEPRIEIRRELGGGARARTHPAEIMAAVVNLVTNSMEAMPEGGTIVVRAGTTDGRAWIEVEDDGIGMTDEVQARAFEPFYTTKGDTGTGLGLATVYAFVKQYRGDVVVRSAPGQGTTIRLVFPSA